MSSSEQDGRVSVGAASRILREAALPLYLVDAVLAVAPPRLTKGTLRLLVRYLAHRRHADRVTRGEPSVEELTDSQLGARLHDRWESEGGAATDLVKFIAMAEYRVRALRSVLENPAGGPTAAELDAFWLAGGHDLTELAVFLAHVDNELADWLPK